MCDAVLPGNSLEHRADLTGGCAGEKHLVHMAEGRGECSSREECAWSKVETQKCGKDRGGDGSPIEEEKREDKESPLVGSGRWNRC